MLAMSRLRALTVVIAVSIVGMTAVPGSAAAPTAQRACTKAGARATIAGTKSVCVRTAKGLVWMPQGNSSGGGSQQGQQLGSANSITWSPTADGWRANGTPPVCPAPLVIEPPVDVARATSILYPGQTRGGNYKAHGGFRFDSNADNAIAVHAPMAGSVVLGARYLVSGEVQYTFDIMSPCGIMNRLGHLLVLAPRMQAIADRFPAPQENDSRTTFVSPPVPVAAGELLATQVGVTRPAPNVFLDWGVYDYRSTNASAASPVWAGQHAQDFALAGHALCWLELLPPQQKARVATLPAADPASGRTSDFCRA